MKKYFEARPDTKDSLGYIDPGSGIARCELYPDCCGAKILSGFYGMISKGKEVSDTANRLRSWIASWGPYAYQAILSDEENEEGWEEVLELVGFTKLHSFESGITGNTLSVFHLDPLEESCEEGDDDDY